MATSDLISFRAMRLSLLLATATLALAQDNRVPVNNDYVRVVRAHNTPGQKSRLHKHDVNRIMIHIDDGKMRLAYADGKVQDIPWKAGDVRWDPANGMHTSENIGGTSYNIVEVELKKPGGGPVSLPAQDPVKADPKHYKVLIENEQVRVVRAKYGAGEKGPVHEHVLPRLTVNLTDQSAKLFLPDGSTRDIHNPAGQIAWTDTPAKHSEINLKDQPFEVIMVEVKSK